MGTEFIKTLQECSEPNEENMMKRMILLALDDEVDLINIIRNNYRGKEDDLKAIFSTLKKVIDRTPKITYDEVENFFRITEKNYTLDYQSPALDRRTRVSIRASRPSRIKIKKGKQKQTTPHFKIRKSKNLDIHGNHIIDDLSDVEFMDIVQQQMSAHERQLRENENQK